MSGVEFGDDYYTIKGLQPPGQSGVSALECPSCGASLSWVATGGGTITGTVRATCRECGVKLGITFHGSVDNVTIGVADVNAAMYIYWCPRCEKQTERGWHTYRRGDPLIPQNDEEHECERVPVVRAAVVGMLLEATKRALVYWDADDVDSLDSAMLEVEKAIRQVESGQ